MVAAIVAKEVAATSRQKQNKMFTLRYTHHMRQTMRL
jgi:hypothetical protein